MSLLKHTLNRRAVSRVIPEKTAAVRPIGERPGQRPAVVKAAKR